MSKLVLACLMAASSFAFAKTNNASDAVGVTILPSQPIVFTSPLTYVDNAGKTVTVAAPWTRFQVSMTVPQGSQPVTVIHLNAQVTAKNPTGEFMTTNSDFDPSSDSFTDSTGNVCSYMDYGQIDPSGEMVMLGESTANCPSLSPIFYVGGLPKTDNLKMNMMITPEGWFGTRTSPVDRFQHSVTVVTQ